MIEVRIGFIFQGVPIELFNTPYPKSRLLAFCYAFAEVIKVKNGGFQAKNQSNLIEVNGIIEFD